MCVAEKMAGQYSHERPYYRCKYPLEYALANEVDHPRNVYVSEDPIVIALDEWLARLFDPDNLEATWEQLAAASGPAEADAARIDAATRQLADCDARLAKYRTALETGADPTVVATWIAEVQGERLAADRILAEARPTTTTPAEIRALVERMGDLTEVLASADPQLKTELYGDLGVRLTYRPDEELVSVEAAPFGRPKCVSEGGLEPPRPCGH